jgi:hypothetical protein
MNWAPLLAQKSDIRLSRGDKTDKCDELLNELSAVVGVHQIVKSSVVELDFVFPILQAVDINVTESIEVVMGEICEVDRNLEAVEVYDDSLLVSKKVGCEILRRGWVASGAFYRLLLALLIVFWTRDHTKHLGQYLCSPGFCYCIFRFFSRLFQQFHPDLVDPFRL